MMDVDTHNEIANHNAFSFNNGRDGNFIIKHAGLNTYSVNILYEVKCDLLIIALCFNSVLPIYIERGIKGNSNLKCSSQQMTTEVSACQGVIMYSD